MANDPDSLWRMLARAALRRCPYCGGRGWFTSWFKKTERCVDCGYGPERQDGFVLGAVAINTIVTFGVILMVLVTGVIVTYPDIPALPIVIPSVVLGALVPILFFPLSHTIWAAIDLAMRPLDPAEEADAINWLAARGTADRGS
jgi:uncharacterized protein (DUF983 family)